MASSVGRTPCVHVFGHRIAHLPAIFGVASLINTVRFGSLEFPTPPLAGMWVPPVFAPFQTFHFGSLYFIADQLGVLRLRKEALVPASTGGGVPSTDPGSLNDLNDKTLRLHFEPALGSNPTVSDVHTVIYSLFNTFHQLPGGTPLPPPRLSCGRFPYSFASPADADALGCWRMQTPPPLMSEFVGMASYAPASFHDLIDDDVESDGSSISDVMAPGHPLPRERVMADAKGQLPVVVEYRPTPLRTLVRKP